MEVEDSGFLHSSVNADLTQQLVSAYQQFVQSHKFENHELKENLKAFYFEMKNQEVMQKCAPENIAEFLLKVNDKFFEAL